MKQMITKSGFRDAFRNMGRADQFTYDALGMMFDYFDDIDPDYELDVIGICCDYSELSPDEIIDQYGVDIDDGADDDDRLYAVKRFLQDNTSVIGQSNDGYIVFAQF